ncbi:MAG: LysM peptidoglycan-binding domain-containing protein [Myxococcota bacterium]
MRRIHFLTIALALVAASASFAAEESAAPASAPAAEAAPAPSPESAVTPEPAVVPGAVEATGTAAPETTAQPSTATRRSIVLGPQGVDEQGRVGRLHTVSRGDTLWDISGAYLGTPWVWPSVWTDNREIANPHRIDPGDRIWITANEMRVVSDAEADAFLENLLETPAAPEPDLASDEMEPMDEPEVEMIPEEPLMAAVPEATPAGRQITVSTRAAVGFVTAEQLEGASSIVDSPSERTYVVEGDHVYLGLGEGDTQVGDRFTIFEVVEEVRDPRSARIIGHHVDVLGWLEVRELTGDTSIAEIRMSYAEMRRGARITPKVPVPRHVTVLHTPEANSGEIVFLPGRKTVMADGGYVYLNRGELDGLEIGSELEVFDRGQIYNDVPRDVDVQTPDHKVATLVVVSMESQTAVAFVLNSERELEIGDAVRPRSARLAAR